MKILVLGGDGFCGWPTALHLSNLGHDVTIVDNLSRRRIDAELGVESLVPIATLPERIRTWKSETGRDIGYEIIDLAKDIGALKALLSEVRPDSIVHFAEQRSAPYSMQSAPHKRYTVDGNVSATHNLLSSLVELNLDTHIVHLGTMGVYGYSSVGAPIPEGYLSVQIENGQGEMVSQDILYPANPGSVYHLTKCLDQMLFAYYAKNDGVRITDLHQGIVWGTNTAETELHPNLANRFDYDGVFGTVLNRFLIQAALGHPLTVHGTGGQTRAFIHIRDSVKCIQLAIETPPETGERVKIFNQATETHMVRDLAGIVSKLTGCEVAFVTNPRNEAAENNLMVVNEKFLDLGLKPTLLEDGLLTEIVQIAEKYKPRVDLEKVPARAAWTREIADQFK